jgi:hypothetical protein
LTLQTECNRVLGRALSARLFVRHTIDYGVALDNRQLTPMIWPFRTDAQDSV